MASIEKELEFGHEPGCLDVHTPTLYAPPEEPIVRITRVPNVSRFDCLGSLFTHINVKLPDVGLGAALSQWNEYKNSSVIEREDGGIPEGSQS
ncbi:hypothetical protein ACHAP5_009876 [Fusarium lateritium]